MSHQLSVGWQQQWAKKPWTTFAAGSPASQFHPGFSSSRSISSLDGRASSSLCGGQKGATSGKGLPRRYSIRGARVDPNRLVPLPGGICPDIQKVKHQEMEDMKHLNSKFAGFVEKVRGLEQKNQLLATKWTFLQANPFSRSLEAYFEQYISNLRRRMESLMYQKGKLETDCKKAKELVEDSKYRYEEKLNEHTAAKNTFLELKKDADDLVLTNADLEARVSLILQEIQFLRLLYTVRLEYKPMYSNYKKRFNSRSFDMSSIVADIKKEYEEVVQRSKVEADAFYQNKYEEAQNKRCNFKGDLKRREQQISELTRTIKKLQSEINLVQKENTELQKAVCNATERGDCALKDAQRKHGELVEALSKAKNDLAGLLRGYQQLLNVKIALDMEILAYNSLLEG